MTEQRRTAVALAYRAAEAAPRVIAKGSSEIAERIVEQAKLAGIPVAQSPELANLLLRVDLGREVPPELYLAIAQTLVWAYSIKPKAS
jgi:flagellar biosynthesis protein